LEAAAVSLQLTRRSGAGLVPLVLLALLFGCRHEDDSQTDRAHVPVVVVRTVPAEIRSIEETVDGIGRSEALPNNLVTLTPAVEGHVDRIPVALGDLVHRGDPIVELDTRIAKADTAEKRANRDTLKAALELLRVEPRLEDRKGLEVAVEQAKATVDSARAAVDRLQPLEARHEVSAAQLYDAQQLLVQAQLQQRSAEAQLQLLLVGPKPEAVAEAQARLEAAEGALALSQATLDLHSIRSPIDGVLDSLTCHPGQTITPGTAIGEVVDAKQLNVVVWLPPQSAAAVRVGQAARLAIGESLPRHRVAATSESETNESGNVVSIGRIVDPQTGNLPVRILVENPLGRVAVGETLSVTILVQERANELAVPSSALIDLGEGPHIVVVRDGKIAQVHPKSVTTHGDWTVISGSDLQAGEQVVIEGGFNLPEGTPVQVRSGVRHSVAEAR
jgi:RND family efflux transporter MFP subunit